MPPLVYEFAQNCNFVTTVASATRKYRYIYTAKAMQSFKKDREEMYEQPQ